jgi:hypothetical protein
MNDELKATAFSLQFIILHSAFIIFPALSVSALVSAFSFHAPQFNAPSFLLKTFLTSRTLIHIEALSFNGTCVVVGLDIASGSVWSCRKNVV